MSARLYHDTIVATARRAWGRGRLEAPDGHATVDNPLCGDRVRIDLCLDEGAVAEIAHEVRGCLLCEAAASVIGAHATGIAVVDLRRLDRRLRRHLGGEEIAFEAPWDALRMFDPVRGYRSRHECVLLPFDALGRALAGAEEAQSAGKAT